jgi:hypothetical protein
MAQIGFIPKEFGDGAVARREMAALSEQADAQKLFLR